MPTKDELTVREVELLRAIVDNDEQSAALHHLFEIETRNWQTRVLNIALEAPKSDSMDRLQRITEASARARQLEEIMRLLHRKVYG